MQKITPVKSLFIVLVLVCLWPRIDTAVALAAGIALTLIIGRLIGKALKVTANTSELITFGTAICGGSDTPDSGDSNLP
jgi:Na+/H+ antiporter NhaC